MRIIFAILIFMIALPFSLLAALAGFLYAKCLISFMQSYNHVMRHEFSMQQKALEKTKE